MFIRNNKGYTLIELIIVVALIVTITAIAVPKYLDVEEKAKENADYATGAMIAKAAELYYVREETIPDILTVKQLVDAKYLSKLEFKSDKFSGITTDKITVTFNENVVEKVHAGDTIFYPRP